MIHPSRQVPRTTRIAKRLHRIVLIPVLAATSGVLPVVNSVDAAPHMEKTSQIRPQSVSCGVRVYMTASGTSGTDATNDGLVESRLEDGTTLCITVGVNYYDLSTVAGTVTTANYDVIYLQGQNNWGSSSRAQFNAADFAVINDFLVAGGGVVIGEWHAWNACAQSFAGAWADLDAIMPVTIRTGCSYGSNMKVRFYRWERPLSPLIDTGVNADFIFEPADFAGSLSFLNLKTGATPYYWATWNTNRANIPAAVAPDQLPSAGGLGMAGWVPTGKTGRVFAFSTTNGAPELADTSSANSFRRLLVNALGWSGSVGGSINPDAVAVASTNGSVSTPALNPSRMSGTVTYTIVSGNLPNGLSLNPSTGSITGTSTENGSFTVTIQATGSISGSAQANVSFQVSGAATTTTTAPTTTIPSNTTTTLVSSPTTATTTTTPAVDAATEETLPKTGTSSSLMSWMATVLVLMGVALVGYRRRSRAQINR